MRAHEFITEAKMKRKPMHKGAEHAAPNMTFYGQQENRLDTYAAYRFGVALAHSPEGRKFNATAYSNNFMMIDYTEEDAKIRQAAEKAMGIKTNHSTGKGSKEAPNHINKVSPVAKPKRNKYGV